MSFGNKPTIIKGEYGTMIIPSAQQATAHMLGIPLPQQQNHRRRRRSKTRKQTRPKEPVIRIVPLPPSYAILESAPTVPINRVPAPEPVQCFGCDAILPYISEFGGRTVILCKECVEKMR